MFRINSILKQYYKSVSFRPSLCLHTKEKSTKFFIATREATSNDHFLLLDTDSASCSSPSCLPLLFLALIASVSFLLLKRTASLN